MALERGTRLGPYQIESPIGAGGMSEVYKATDTRLERTVAIKVLPAHVASDPERKSRFEREAKTVAALSHPHICPVFDVGFEIPSPPRGEGQGEGDASSPTDFLVMEYLEGETLADRLHKGAPPLDQALRYAIEIADALDKAHRQGVTHRDLKPANIFLHESRGPTPTPSRSATDAPPAGRRRSEKAVAKLKPTGRQSEANAAADARSGHSDLSGERPRRAMAERGRHRVAVETGVGRKCDTGEGHRDFDRRSARLLASPGRHRRGRHGRGASGSGYVAEPERGGGLQDRGI